ACGAGLPAHESLDNSSLYGLPSGRIIYSLNPSHAGPAALAAPTPERTETALNADVLWLHELRLSDLAQVGGKNSSLGEMIGQLAHLGVSVPGGFATTAHAFREFIAHNNLHQRIYDRLGALDV